MKKYCSLILTLCLAAALAGCGITTLPTPEDPESPAAADPEEITYEVTTDPHEETVHAEDGTLLMTVSFQLPHLQQLQFLLLLLLLQLPSLQDLRLHKLIQIFQYILLLLQLPTNLFLLPTLASHLLHLPC